MILIRLIPEGFKKPMERKKLLHIFTALFIVYFFVLFVRLLGPYLGFRLYIPYLEPLFAATERFFRSFDNPLGL